MAAPLLSFCAPGRPDICEKPVLWGVRFEPRALGLPDDELPDAEDAMPLYLRSYMLAVFYRLWYIEFSHIIWSVPQLHPAKSCGEDEKKETGKDIQILHQYI